MTAGLADLAIPVDPAFLTELREDPAKLEELVRCAEDFAYFLRYWEFRDQESGEIRKLGEELWEGQLEFAATVRDTPALYALKARKLGYTTIECAYDAWVIRFRGKNGRAHLFSRREKAAQGLLDQVKFGLRRLPPWMKLPEGTVNSSEYELVAGPDDRRIAVAYPADEDTAVEDTCTHGHVDEWARMRNPQRVWQAIEPSMAGTCHIITTGLGPANYSAHFWRRCMRGEATCRNNTIKPFFQGALKRPGRTAEWVAKRYAEDETAARQEYPLTWQDALYGGGDYVFRGTDLDAAQRETDGAQAPNKDRKYIIAWDIGRHADAAVGVVLDITTDVHDVVHYVRFRGMRYPDLQQQIEILHARYGRMTAIEANSAGEAVAENCDISEHELILFKTTGTSKPRIIQGLRIAFQQQTLRYAGWVWPQLDAELREYQIPDDNIVQDSVMALAIAEDCASSAYLKRGKVRSVLTW